MKIGIFGGTFNPPHIGHIKSALSAMRQLKLNKLFVVPAGIPPHKTLSADTPPAEMRLQMTRTAFEGPDMPGVSVLDYEIYGNEPGYTIDTVKRIRQEYANVELYLLVGTDMYLTLETWKESGELLKIVKPAVFFRFHDDKESVDKYSERVRELSGLRTRIITCKTIDISSSQLRGMLPQREGIGYIADTTYAYIVKHRLYGVKPDWDWLRAKAHSMLGAERVGHVKGCEEEALRLAERWGADMDDAREAAILHDITKKLTRDENIKLLRQHGIDVGELRPAEEKLLHSRTGAILAQSEFGSSQAVQDAIMWHTTGRAGMSLLEKLIYIADYIEPTRYFAGVNALRTLAYVDIDAAMRMGLEMSVEDMQARGIAPNATTFDALKSLK